VIHPSSITTTPTQLARSPNRPFLPRRSFRDRGHPSTPPSGARPTATSLRHYRSDRRGVSSARPTTPRAGADPRQSQVGHELVNSRRRSISHGLAKQCRLEPADVAHVRYRAQPAHRSRSDHARSKASRGAVEKACAPSCLLRLYDVGLAWLSARRAGRADVAIVPCPSARSRPLWSVHATSRPRRLCAAESRCAVWLAEASQRKCSPRPDKKPAAAVESLSHVVDSSIPSRNGGTVPAVTVASLFF